MDVGDRRLEVVGDEYDVETDAFGDGCMTYYPAVLARKMERGDDG